MGLIKTFSTQKETCITGHSNSSCDPSIDHAWLSLCQSWSRDLMLGSDWPRMMFWHWPLKVTHVQWWLQLDPGHPGEIWGKIATLRLLSAIIEKDPELLFRIPEIFFSSTILCQTSSFITPFTLFWLWTNDLYHSDQSHTSLSPCVSNRLSMFQAPAVCRRWKWLLNIHLFFFGHKVWKSSQHKTFHK